MFKDTWIDIQENRKHLHDVRKRLKKRRCNQTTVTNVVDPDENINQVDLSNILDWKLERELLLCLCETPANPPVAADVLVNSLRKRSSNYVDLTSEVVESLLCKFAAQQMITLKNNSGEEPNMQLFITAKNQEMLEAYTHFEITTKLENQNKALKTDDKKRWYYSLGSQEVADLIQFILSTPSVKETEEKKQADEILGLLDTSSTKELSLQERFKSRNGGQFQMICEHITALNCQKSRKAKFPCKKLHFKRIIQEHTEESLGDCSFLNSCFNVETCKYVHYDIDNTIYGEDSNKDDEELAKSNENASTVMLYNQKTKLCPPQWIRCDLRYFDMSILGKFDVIMADPPWDIHMELPYGTMTDDEMRKLPVPCLQDDGFIFLWVTGRAMEIGRDCLKIWGYEQIEEIIWVKTNQLQRIIRTGRTGHWLNHGKEHCLVGMKGSPRHYNRGFDCDVIVAELRDTSHKPDETYGLIERLCPGSRKIELFGRQHNTQPNWVTLGNQVDGVHLIEPALIARYKKRYGKGDPMPSKR